MIGFKNLFDLFCDVWHKEGSNGNKKIINRKSTIKSIMSSNDHYFFCAFFVCFLMISCYFSAFYWSVEEPGFMDYSSYLSFPLPSFKLLKRLFFHST